MKKGSITNKKLFQMISAALMAAMLLTGCGSASDKAGYATTTMAESATADYANDAGMMSDDMYMADAEEAYEEADYPAEAETEMKDLEAGGGDNGVTPDKNVASNRKLIKRVNLSVETQEFETLTAKIEAKVADLGGYIESSNVYGNGYNSNSSRNADYTARVPVNKLDDLVNAVAKVSNVTNKSESATDVTLEYVDTKSRKDALKVEQERMMSLLEQADDLETIIGLESRLTEIRYELQSLESKLRTYDNLVDYATVAISVREVKIYTPVETPEKTTWQKMTEGFVNSLQDVGWGIVNFFVGLVIALPYLVVWAVVITIIVLIIKAMIKGGKKRKEKKAQKKLMKQQQMMVNVNTEINKESSEVKSND